MKRKDFIALATALVAAKRFDKVESDDMYRCQEDGTVICRSDKVEVTAHECYTIARALEEVLDLEWTDEPVEPNGAKRAKDEEFFTDDEQTDLGRVADQLEDLNDTMCHGEESIGGSLLKMAKAVSGMDLETELSAISDAIEELKQ